MAMIDQPLRQISTTPLTVTSAKVVIVFPELLLTSGAPCLQQRDDLSFHCRCSDVMFHMVSLLHHPTVGSLSIGNKHFQTTSIEQGILIHQAQDHGMLKRGELPY